MERTGTASDGEGDQTKKKIKADASIICDDVLLDIFFRLPTRSIMHCALVSRHHRQLVGDPDFWHRRDRQGPPFPRPYIAYMATASITTHYLYHEFHLIMASSGEGGQRTGGGNHDLRRTLFDRDEMFAGGDKYFYVGTCSGVVLLARRARYHNRSNVIFFNPSVAGCEVVEINLPPLSPYTRSSRHRVVGFGYGPLHRRHKLLVTREEESTADRGFSVAKSTNEYKAKELLVYNVIGRNTNHGEPSSRILHSGLDAKISGKSVYLDGKVYLLVDYSKVLAFDVDHETVTTIDLPGERAAGNDSRNKRHAKSKLMEMSGRLCVATFGGLAKLTLWLLTPDGQWQRRCDFWTLSGVTKVVGAWDCGGVVLLFYMDYKKAPRLHLSDPEGTDRVLEDLHIPRVLVNLEKDSPNNRLAVCWGYQPTLVPPPGSIVGAPPRQLGGRDLAAAVNPLLERDMKTGKERTQPTVCFMNMLLYIMRQLPHGRKDITKEFNPRSLPFVLR